MLTLFAAFNADRLRLCATFLLLGIVYDLDLSAIQFSKTRRV